MRVEVDRLGHDSTALGSRAPLSAEDGRITLRILVDRTSVEVFANHGRVQLANCFVPAEDSNDLTLRSTGFLTTRDALTPVKQAVPG